MADDSPGDWAQQVRERVGDHAGVVIVVAGATTLAPLADLIRELGRGGRRRERRDWMTARYAVHRAPVVRALAEGFVADLERRATGRAVVGELLTGRVTAGDGRGGALMSGRRRIAWGRWRGYVRATARTQLADPNGVRAEEWLDVALGRIAPQAGERDRVALLGELR